MAADSEIQKKIKEYADSNGFRFRIKNFQQTDDPLLCVGMFGVCATTTFRQTKFIPKFEEEQINWYNPQLGEGEWNRATSPIEEAKHLAADQIILFPITRDSYALGSLSESGFGIIQSISLNDRRHVVILIDKELDERLISENEQLANESLKCRALVYQHLRKLRLPNVYMVDTLDEMLDVAVLTYRTAEALAPLSEWNPHKRQYG